MKAEKKIFLVVIIFLLLILALAFKFFTWQKSQPAHPAYSGDQQARPVSEIIIVEPPAGQTVSSPLNLFGQAVGGWYFEASFPVELVDGQGSTIARSYVQAQSDWQTVSLVPFRGELNYQLAATTTGKLIFKKDNPSGLPENDQSFTVPVVITPNQNMTIKVFFNNNILDPEIGCDKVFGLERILPKAQSVARAALEQLIAGPSSQEKSQGYYTNINPAAKIEKLTIDQGLAKVDFNQALEQPAGGSCRVSAIRAQISQTLKQFPTVKEVIISVGGRTEDVLQP